MGSSRISRRSLIAAIGATGVTRAASAQTPQASPASQIRIPKLRIGMASLPQLDAPFHATAMDAMWFSTIMFDAPMRWNAEGVVIPGVFSTTASSKSTQVRLQPRSGTVFGDGDTLTARHAVESITAILNSTHAWRLQNVAEITELDDATVQITMERSDASLMASLSHPLFGLDAGGVGTGPFIRQPENGTAALFRRNPRFWQIGRPHIDELEIAQIPDDTQRSLAMATGEIDILPNVPLLDVPMLENEPTVYLVGGPSNRLCHLQLRISEPVLASRRVRQILAGAIDRARLVAVATANQAVPTSTLFLDDGWTEDIEEVPHISSDNVRSELRALGIPSDLRLHLLADNADSTLANTAVVLQEQLAQCGISLSITLLEGDELTEATETGAYDLLVSYSEPWRDPHELVWPLLSSLGPLNWSGFNSIEVDTLLRAAIAISDREFRVQRYSRLETVIRKDVPCIPLFRPYVWDAVSTGYPGYSNLPPATSRGMMTLLPTDAA